MSVRGRDKFSQPKNIVGSSVHPELPTRFFLIFGSDGNSPLEGVKKHLRRHFSRPSIPTTT